MQRLACWPSWANFAEETLITVIRLHLRLLGNLPYISGRNALEERHTFEYRFDRTRIVQLLEETTHGGHNLHQALHHLFGHFQYDRCRLRAGGYVALLPGEHTVLTHVLSSPQDG